MPFGCILVSLFACSKWNSGNPKSWQKCYRKRERKCNGEGLSKVKASKYSLSSLLCLWFQHGVSSTFLFHVPSKLSKTSLRSCNLSSPLICRGQSLLCSCCAASFYSRGIRRMVYVTQLRSGEDPELRNTLKNASCRGGRAAN